MTIAGIDVSNVNGEPFPWLAWRGKIQFAGIKVSEGTWYQDPDATANIAAARALGLVVMGYHFLHNGTDKQGGAPQAEYFLRCAKAAGLKPGDLIALDVEDGGLDIDRGKASPQDVEQALIHFDLVAAGFLHELQKHENWANYNAVVYTEISMAPSLTHCGESPLWLADPSGTPVTSVGPWKLVSFIQNGQRGVDTDVFNGTVEQLRALAIPAK